MSQPATLVTAETQTLRDAYAALNRNDISGFVKSFDPEIEWSEFIGLPGGGTYRGLAAVQEYVAKSRSNWAEGTCEPQRFLIAGDKIIVFVHVHVRLKNETEWREGDLGDVYTFRNGKVVAVRVFAEARQAIEWVGVKTEREGNGGGSLSLGIPTDENGRLSSVPRGIVPLKQPD